MYDKYGMKESVCVCVSGGECNLEGIKIILVRKVHKWHMFLYGKVFVEKKLERIFK